MSEKRFTWIQLEIPDRQFRLQLQIELVPRLRMESSLFYMAYETKRKKIRITCSSILTMRAGLKILEYCTALSSSSEISTSQIVPFLGIYGDLWQKECLLMCRLLDLKLFIQQFPMF